MTLQMQLTQADLIAALQAWVASTSGGSIGGITHQMNATITPIIVPSGGVIVDLNF